MEDEEILLRARSRAIWLREGDKNTKFFHARVNSRKKKNRISSLENVEGVMSTEKHEMVQAIQQFYSELFTTSNPIDPETALEGLDVCVSEEQNAALIEPYTEDDVSRALFHMNPSKAPGIDGMDANFYQKH